MLPNADTTPDHLAALRRVDAAADRFEAAWKSGGEPPRITEFLDGPDSLRCLLLCELIEIDMIYQWRHGQPPDLENYLRRFPELRHADALLMRRLEARCQRLPTLVGSSQPQPQAGGISLPATIGKYLLVSRLGEGGQSVVYRAVHRELGRDVALKTSKATVADDAQAALRSEGQLLAGLDHPNLARVYDLDFHEGRALLAMEYVRGRTLNQFAEQERPAPARAAGLLAGVARALAVAHARGITHRDVKPGNVIIDESGTPRLIDFGLAQLRDAHLDGRDPEGSICGTVAFMSPEQARGEASRVGPSSDVFGLGAVLYYLLTGHAPFEAPTQAAALRRAREAVIDAAPLQRPEIPRRLRAVCLRALETDPARRQANADELAGDLEACARPPRWGWRVAALAAVVLLAAALVFAGVKWLIPNPQPATPLSVGVWRAEAGKVDLAAAVPLQTGEELAIEGSVPARRHASLFLINGAGQIQHLKDYPPQDRPHAIRYPEGEEVVPLRGPDGTEVFLLLASRSGPVPIDVVRASWQGEEAWPALPGRTILRLGLDGVEDEQRERDLGPPRTRTDPTDTVRSRLDALRQRLRERCDFIDGVAVRHGE